MDKQNIIACMVSDLSWVMQGAEFSCDAFCYLSPAYISSFATWQTVLLKEITHFPFSFARQKWLPELLLGISTSLR